MDIEDISSLMYHDEHMANFRLFLRFIKENNIYLPMKAYVFIRYNRTPCDLFKIMNLHIMLDSFGAENGPAVFSNVVDNEWTRVLTTYSSPFDFPIAPHIIENITSNWIRYLYNHGRKTVYCNTKKMDSIEPIVPDKINFELKKYYFKDDKTFNFN